MSSKAAPLLKRQRSWASDERRRAADMKRKYGITIPQYEEMERRQGGCCAICRRAPKPGGRRLSVDHDHKTGRVRGLLCFQCNHKTLGRGREHPELHERAAAYLRSTFDGREL